MSDYFCSAHNHIKYINPVPHLLYESRLRLYFRKNIDMMKINIEDSLLEINNNLQDYIDNKHMEYIIAERNMLNDFNYTTNTVSSVFIYILCKFLNISTNVELTNITSNAYITAC
ncbi:hypothetical protein Bccel_2936 [Pseudobacteroides cellulosolvens ATCC 35603 = DSM 2933]|uniref:Uncharacterized protein n=1 Tax=Pseudobacteroides cellulosolvens ATCC 35603 = DSM 2933 TaxID=398512 RepID=A0A0L6JPM7_9FIRM|nr:hypothetical protein [Pseudobacteroides cellulosolvens]KNY27665.1 hypothetical protein Bccel_2936 [Pseudobacteroides cellulosolvens ATCC 35603 = DSM 2933]